MFSSVNDSQYMIFYCCYLCLLNNTLTFLDKANVYKSVSVPLSRDNDMHAYAHSRWTNNDDKNQQNSQLLGLAVSYITHVE